jgi:2-oxoglutarate ferredoxin oxidoreductase subunit gamma
MVLNIVMTGFFTAVTGLLAAESVKKAVLDSVPAHSKELNSRAFDAGFDYGQKVLEGAAPALAHA